jgi:hypothetical protein
MRRRPVSPSGERAVFFIRHPYGPIVWASLVPLVQLVKESGWLSVVLELLTNLGGSLKPSNHEPLQAVRGSWN